MGAMEFYEEMAKAIKDRDHANSMVIKWMAKAEEAGLAIERLIIQQDGLQATRVSEEG